MKVAVTQFISLDGVSQGPGSADEDTSDGFDRGGWLVPYIDDTFVAQASAWLDLADGLLLGRRTYEAFARDWPQISEPDPFTARMNGLPKYVVSSTLTTGSWSPTTLLGGEAVTSSPTPTTSVCAWCPTVPPAPGSFSSSTRPPDRHHGATTPASPISPDSTAVSAPAVHCCMPTPGTGTGTRRSTAMLTCATWKPILTASAPA